MASEILEEGKEMPRSKSRTYWGSRWKAITGGGGEKGEEIRDGFKKSLEFAGIVGAFDKEREGANRAEEAQVKFGEIYSPSSGVRI